MISENDNQFTSCSATNEWWNDVRTLSHTEKHPTITAQVVG